MCISRFFLYTRDVAFATKKCVLPPKLQLRKK
jgi:hypothetical protein